MSGKNSILNIYDEVFSSNHVLSKGIIKQHIQKIKELDQVLPHNSSFFILTNTTFNNFPFVSLNFQRHLGLDPEKMKSEGSRYWLSQVHPDDLPVWVNMLNDLMQFTMTQIKPEKRRYLSYTWNFRVRKSNGKYVNLYEHQSPMELDEDGKPIVGLGHITVIGNGDEMPIKASVCILNDENEYETIYSRNYSGLALIEEISNRERDIIRLLVLRKSSKEIAQLLHISRHTVDTHRRNILKKLNLKSTGEMVAYAQLHQLY
nr:LuxR C-terminal-related transcriptional regulator [uncultured Carboxylicivirga sp.]